MKDKFQIGDLVRVEPYRDGIKHIGPKIQNKIGIILKVLQGTDALLLIEGTRYYCLRSRLEKLESHVRDEQRTMRNEA